MTQLSLFATLAGAFSVLFLVTTLLHDRVVRAGNWLIPAALSLAFLLFSLQAVYLDGPLGFWTEHVRNMWGNQIWIDLLLAICIGWFLIVPQAKAVSMNLKLWLVLIVCTGCIGFLAMVARMLYLQGQFAGGGPTQLSAAPQ